MKLVLGYLYGDLMNIYGDSGNIICLQKRAEWRGIEVEVRLITQSSKLKAHDCDLLFFGGGQDQQQELVAKDLVISNKGKVIREEVERGVPLLAICGGYQLLGEYYQPFEGEKLPGVGVFPVFTKASNNRMIGNIVIGSLAISHESVDKTKDQRLTTNDLFVGFENHSGKTYLKEGAVPLGKVKSGFGNNGEDGNEGVIYKNAIGCYMHGSLLPKNPILADFLIQKALEVKYGKEVKLKPLDDSFEEKAHNFAIQKFSK